MSNLVHFPVKIAFNHFEYSESIENHIYKHAKKLETYCDRIINCKLSIGTHHHHNKGKIYHIRIDLIVPNAELVANRNPTKNESHKDVYVAIRDAFNALIRQLQKHTEKQRGAVKHHEPRPEGRIFEIAPIADYGFIETIDGRRLRFTSESVIGFDFTKLEIGTRVAFVEASSNDGPAASTVYIK